MEAVRAIRMAGFRVAIDDFGVGYTSIQQHMQESLAAIVAFCHAQGKRVNAEGVGTLEKQSALLQAGCDLFQGYLISPPRSVATLAEWVAIRNHTPADLNLEPQKLALR